MNSKSNIRLKKGNIDLLFNREELNVVDETGDGIVFKLKNGIMISFEDQFMPSGTKQKIKLTVDKFPNGDIEVDFNNWKSPVVVISK